jgi:Na+/proline symporter
VALAIVPEAEDVVHVIGMLAVSTMLPLLVAVKLDGVGLTVQTVDGTADDGLMAMPKAAAAVPATTAVLLRDFFITLKRSLWIDRQRVHVTRQ